MKIIQILMAAFAVMVLVGCSGSTTPEEGNLIPTANAEGDKTVEIHHSVSITGTANDSDGTIISYEWEDTNGFLADTATFDYTPTSTGIHTLTLTVMDDDGDIGQDSMLVNVTNPPVNNAPTVEADIDTTMLVHNTATITGTASDSDGTIASVEWTENGNFLADTLSFNYTPSTTGNHTLTLTVTDDDGATGSDTMVVNATATPVNQAPEWTQASYDTGLTIDDSTDDTRNIMDLKFVTSDAENDPITYSIVSISVPGQQIEWDNSVVIESGVLKVKNLMINDPDTNGNVIVTVKAEATGGSNNADITFTFTFNNVQ